MKVTVVILHGIAGTKYVDDANRVFMAGLVASFAALVAAAAGKVLPTYLYEVGTAYLPTYIPT